MHRIEYVIEKLLPEYEIECSKAKGNPYYKKNE
jgi:hypothetical protein